MAFSSRFLFRSGALFVSSGACGLVAYHHDDIRPFFRTLQAKSILDPHGMDFKPSKWDFNWDKRQVETKTDENKEQSAAKASRHLLLIRHGQYNMEGETDDQRHLTDLGRNQARETGARLASLSLPLTKVIRSNMKRAVETADLIMEELEERGQVSNISIEDPDPILREGSPIRPEPDVGHWHSDHEYDVSGSRIEAAFRKYFHRADADQSTDSYELMVCHANVIRYFVCRALQLPPEAWLRMSLRHASITWITIRPDGKVSLRTFGDSGHFKPEEMTVSYRKRIL